MKRKGYISLEELKKILPRTKRTRKEKLEFELEMFNYHMKDIKKDLENNNFAFESF